MSSWTSLSVECTQADVDVAQNEFLHWEERKGSTIEYDDDDSCTNPYKITEFTSAGEESDIDD